MPEWKPQRPFGYGGGDEALDHIRHLEAKLAAAITARDEAERERDNAGLALWELAAHIESMDVQAQKLTKREGGEEIITGYRWNTGSWHRLLGAVRSHDYRRLGTLKSTEQTALAASKARVVEAEVETQVQKGLVIVARILTEQAEARAAALDAALRLASRLVSVNSIDRERAGLPERYACPFCRASVDAEDQQPEHAPDCPAAALSTPEAQ